MNKLYIYGCSFSDVYLPDLYEKGWWELLADHFDIRYELTDENHEYYKKFEII